MPELVVPQSDPKRVGLLRTTQKQAPKDKEQGKNYISDETLQNIDDNIDDYAASVADTGKNLSSKSQELKEEKAAFNQTEITIRDTWAGLKRRIIRDKLPVTLLNLYKLPQDGSVPDSLGTKENLLILAEHIVKGDAEAVAKGFAPMLNPSAEELQHCIDIARQELSESIAAGTAFNDAQTKIAKLRPQAKQLIRDVLDELRFFLRKKEPADRRRIMRFYGFTFKYMEGETRDPDEKPVEE